MSYSKQSTEIGEIELYAESGSEIANRLEVAQVTGQTVEFETVAAGVVQTGSFRVLAYAHGFNGMAWCRLRRA